MPSVTIGTLRLSQSSRAGGLRLALRRIGLAMMSRSAASIEGPWAYCASTWFLRRMCLITWLSSFVQPWLSVLR